MQKTKHEASYRVEYKKSELGEDAVVTGAAAMLIHRLLQLTELH